MATSEIMLDHERLDVYQLARELARVGNAVLQQVPYGRADLIDQFRPKKLTQSRPSTAPAPARKRVRASST